MRDLVARPPLEPEGEENYSRGYLAERHVPHDRMLIQNEDGNKT